jgi:hypothetical protein
MRDNQKNLVDMRDLFLVMGNDRPLNKACQEADDFDGIAGQSLPEM